MELSRAEARAIATDINSEPLMRLRHFAASSPDCMTACHLTGEEVRQGRM